MVVSTEDDQDGLQLYGCLGLSSVLAGRWQKQYRCAFYFPSGDAGFTLNAYEVYPYVRLRTKRSLASKCYIGELPKSSVQPRPLK